MIQISSRANPRFKDVRALKPGFGGARILVEGPKLIEQALLGGLKSLEQWTFGPVVEAAGEVHQIDKDMYLALSPTKTGQPPLMVCEAPPLVQIDSAQLEKGRYLLLDGVQDPGNAGTMARAAAGFGFDAVLWRKPCVYPFHHAAIRASAGAVLRLPQYLVTTENIDPSKHHLIGADLDGESLAQFEKPDHFTLVMGNEGHGLSTDVKNRLRSTVRIESSDRIESLNVSGAAHIIMYNLRRTP